MGDLIETIARRMCEFDGVDPDLPCPGLGRTIPVGETWPAWKVRARKAEAAADLASARTLELVAEWLDEQQRTAQAKMDAGGGDWWEHERDIYWHAATALRSGAFAAWLRERETRGG